MPRRLTVFFRFDDYSETSPLAVEAGLVNALRNNGCCATFGVIPAVTEGRFHEPGERATHPLGAEKIRFLDQAVRSSAVDVALHGFTHRSRVNQAPHSEFVGLSTEEQISQLQQAQELLRRLTGFQPTSFVPPWNRYDASTLEALAYLGFTCLSADRHGPSIDTSLRFLPTTADLSELRLAVSLAFEADDADPIVGLLLHPYDFSESGEDRAVMSTKDFDKELRWLLKQPHVKVMSVSELASSNRALDVARFRANSPASFETVCPPFIVTTDDTPIYRATNAVRREKLWRALAAVAAHGASAIGGGLIATALFAWFEAGAHIVLFMITMAALMLLALFVRTRGRSLYFRSAMAGAFASGLLIAGLFGLP
jgi:uncharacterized protein DUF2334